jgi:hypothetical protein
MLSNPDDLIKGIFEFSNHLSGLGKWNPRSSVEPRRSPMHFEI